MEALRTKGGAAATATTRVIAGDFETLSAREEHIGVWDGVAMCFYIDACGDAIGAAKAARTTLREGGVLVCCGPLEYDGNSNGHSDAMALRLCGDEFLLLLERMGFEILEQRDVPCEYESDTVSMLRMTFECLFIVARKKKKKRTAAATAAGEAAEKNAAATADVQ